MQSMLVIGMGRFGSHLALRLSELGNEVMCVDRMEDRIERVLGKVTDAQIGDCTDENVIEALAVKQYDVCFVCTGKDFQSSLEISSLLKEHGARKVISKADRDIHSKFLLKVGADEVVNPERDMAHRTAIRHSARNVFEYFELAENYAVIEAEIPEAWVGKNALELQIRSKYNVNIIGLKEGQKVIPFTNVSEPFRRGGRIIAAGSTKDLLKLSSGKR